MREELAQALIARIEQNACNQEARQDEEKIDAHPHQLDLHGMVNEDS
jgi:hypothetical protein